MLFLIILILSFAGGYFLPWWIVAIAAIIAAFFVGKSPGGSFWSGFAAVFIGWIILSLFKSLPNDNLLATRVAALFQLPNWVWLLLITGIIGGLVGGMAAMSGVLVRRALSEDKK